MLLVGRTFDVNYRYGFNGKEHDNDPYGQGNVYDYGFRIYNPRLGKFLSVDPLSKNFPELTSFQFASNTPIMAIDIDGLEGFIVTNIYTKINNNDVVLVNTSVNVDPDAQFGQVTTIDKREPLGDYKVNSSTNVQVIRPSPLRDQHNKTTKKLYGRIDIANANTTGPYTTKDGLVNSLTSTLVNGVNGWINDGTKASGIKVEVNEVLRVENINGRNFNVTEIQETTTTTNQQIGTVYVSIEAVSNDDVVKELTANYEALGYKVRFIKTANPYASATYQNPTTGEISTYGVQVTTTQTTEETKTPKIKNKKIEDDTTKTTIVQ